MGAILCPIENPFQWLIDFQGSADAKSSPTYGTWENNGQKQGCMR